MTVQIPRAVEQIEPITFANDATALGLAAYDRLLQLLDQLEPLQWQAPTECPAWDVADMVGHMIGAARANASLREFARQQVWALRHKGEYDGNELDAMNALQVRSQARLTPAERVRALRAIAPRAVAGRRRVPPPLRRVRVPVSSSGSTADGMPDSLSVGHGLAVVYTRDVWLHRVDIARATGRPLDVDPAVDGRIVEDVVAEWAGRHGRPFQLSLSGPAGGLFRSGEGGPHLQLDAIEFCRILSGREAGEGLLAVRVLF